jgi:hypothetical protein
MSAPTPGRIVCFYPHDHAEGAAPLVALVASVHANRRLNLAVFDHYGQLLPTPPQQVLFVHQDEAAPAGRPHCCWPDRLLEHFMAPVASESDVLALAIGDRLRDLSQFVRLIGTLDFALVKEISLAARKALAAKTTDEKITAWLEVLSLLAASTKGTDVDDKIVEIAKSILAGPLREILIGVIDRIVTKQDSGEVFALSVNALSESEIVEFGTAAIDPMLVVEIIRLLLSFWKK